MNMTNYVKCGFPYVFVETQEIKRAVANLTVCEDITKYRWNAVEGIPELAKIDSEGNPVYMYADIEEFLNVLPTLGQKVLVCAELFDAAFESLTVIQTLLNNAYLLKHNHICLCVVTPKANLPAPLEKMFVVLDFPLPSKDEFRSYLKDQCDSINAAYSLGVEYDENVADACVGLALEEGENALAKMLREHRDCYLPAIIEAKRQMYAKTGFMKLVMPEPEDMLGGLEDAVDDLKRRKQAFEPGSKKPKMKAVFLVGIQGCGKSLLAKILGHIFECPVVFGDLGAMKGGLVGDTEKNTRMFTKVTDASGRIVVVLDKLLSSLNSLNCWNPLRAN
jgi:hypothetical protein